ncbi:alpha/beta fold hydrolase [Deinococcus roseus]|uniref:Alpha/beta hydrolase n=1 Tax=Deinococcus roseus TaxID=392414 RepID=A0ABQ2D188_9DEIO|nr:alpha/beta hydrolase [Deinococcus roseus]GGJ36747.1 alpha/beta hydrolase [Deinococcus roseus]
MPYAELNGLQLHYDIHPSSRNQHPPVVLLHGAMEAGTSMEGLRDVLAPRTIILVDLQAHGRTADMDRTMRLETLADDIAALLDHLNFPEVDVVGYSMGGGVALRLAIQHPERVRKMAVMSFPFKSSGRHPEIAAGLKHLGPQVAKGLMGSPPHRLYTALAPRPEDWPQLVTRLGEAMGADFDWTEEVKALQSQVLLVSGDADMFPPAHAAEFFALLGGGKRSANPDGSGKSPHRLLILPSAAHHEVLQSPVLKVALQDFLKD